MAKPKKPELDPPLGRMPVIAWSPPAELGIDPAYQRSIESGESQALIRRIAQAWNWDLCQPLVVSRRREDGTEGLYVIDGQHRLAAAKLRGDIHQLPCVIVEFAKMADEAASFVHLNQQRRPLSRLEIFRAAVASEDERAPAIAAALEAAGLSLAPHMTSSAWKPGQLGNIGGIENAWKLQGGEVTAAALDVIGQAWAGQMLPYAGTLFPGIVAICADEMRTRTGIRRLSDARRELMIAVLGRRNQNQWWSDIAREIAMTPDLGRPVVVNRVLKRAWSAASAASSAAPAPASPPPAPPAPPVARAVPPAPSLKFTADKGWCAQCERMVFRAEAAACQSQFCAVKVAA